MSAPNVEGTSNVSGFGGNQMGFSIIALAEQYATTGNVTGFVAGGSTASKVDSVYAGATGSTAYTVGDIVSALKKFGILAA